jgi:AAHS family benzoate transporter-like MFS transporter
MNHTLPAAETQRSSPGASGTPSDVGRGRFSKASALAVLVCWLLVVFDGYDLIVYGTVQSSLVSDTGWGLTKATAGTIGSMAFLGMMIGAIFAGRMADSWGRRRTILGCAVVFSVFTVLCAPSPPAPLSSAFFGSWQESGSAGWFPPRTPWWLNWSPPSGGPPLPL